LLEQKLEEIVKKSEEEKTYWESKVQKFESNVNDLEEKIKQMEQQKN